MTKRNWTVILMLLLPIIFIYLGVIVGKNFLEDFDFFEATDGIKIFFVDIFIL